jgi:hypothetical protein
MAAPLTSSTPTQITYNSNLWFCAGSSALCGQRLLGRAEALTDVE